MSESIFQLYHSNSLIPWNTVIQLLPRIGKTMNDKKWLIKKLHNNNRAIQWCITYEYTVGNSNSIWSFYRLPGVFERSLFFVHDQWSFQLPPLWSVGNLAIHDQNHWNGFPYFNTSTPPLSITHQQHCMFKMVAENQDLTVLQHGESQQTIIPVCLFYVQVQHQSWEWDWHSRTLNATQ